MDLTIYYDIYVLFTLMCIPLLNYEEKFSSKTKHLIKHFILIMLSVYIGFRPLEVPDTINYVNLFYSDIDCSLLYEGFWKLGYRYNSFEPGFILLIKLFRLFSDSYEIFFCIVSYFTSLMIINGLTGIALYVNNTNKPPIFCVVLIYLFFGGLLYGGVAIRAGLSIGLGLMSINMFLKDNFYKKYIFSLILIFIASKIQTFGFLFLFFLLAIFFGIRINKRIYSILFMILLVFLTFKVGSYVVDFSISFLNYVRSFLGITAFNSYINNIDDRLPLQIVYRVLILGLAIMCVKCKNVKYETFLVLNIIGLAICVILYPVKAIVRLADYFIFSSFVLYCNGIYSYKSNSIFRYGYLIVLLLLFPIQMLILTRTAS